MLMKNGEHYDPTDDQIIEWQSAYPSLDVEQELRQMTCWLAANPSRRKTQRGMGRFIVSWLSRSARQHQRRARPGSTRSTTLHEDLTDMSWAK